ncbi:type II secretion system protein GspC [Idiomarina sp.]|uniref:type II secretion system protein GspC n=1 Tax=Idiomarina sp. TaxID=1874361 RepID=UPI00262B68E6|nr:type II secretion system protein GspC [Idiomarina sp.]
MLAVTAFLWFCVAVLLAEFTWSLLAPDEPESTQPTVPKFNSTSSSANSVDISRIEALHLFGQSEKQGPRNSRNAPKTTLNVRLIGVSASSNPERSAAIIQQGSQQRTYIIGESIGSSRVTVEEIYADRVILDNNGRLETLVMEDVGEDRPALSLTVDEAVADERSPEGSAENDKSRTEFVETELRNIADDPSSIMEYVSISPAMEGGSLVGYRLKAAKNPELFQQAGFQNGDLAVAINGYDLTDMEQAMLASEELANQKQVSIEIERDGERMELSFELPEKQEN